MDVGSVERMLRALPGILDCSVSDEGIAIVVHPEIEPRLMELRAQAALAELGEHRPLLVVGGMRTAGSAAASPAGSYRTARPVARTRSSMPVVGFAVLVIAALTVLPLAGRDSSTSGGRATSEVAAPPAPAAGTSAAVDATPGPGSGLLSITAERVVSVLGPSLVRPLATATTTVGLVRRAVTSTTRASSASPGPAQAVGHTAPAVAAPGPALAAEVPAPPRAPEAKAASGGKDRKLSTAAGGDSASGTSGKHGGQGKAKAGKAGKPDRRAAGARGHR